MVGFAAMRGSCWDESPAGVEAPPLALVFDVEASFSLACFFAEA